jgi:hypothetical protein
MFIAAACSIELSSTGSVTWPWVLRLERMIFTNRLAYTHCFNEIDLVTSRVGNPVRMKSEESIRRTEKIFKDNLPIEETQKPMYGSTYRSRSSYTMRDQFHGFLNQPCSRLLFRFNSPSSQQPNAIQTPFQRLTCHSSQ